MTVSDKFSFGRMMSLLVKQVKERPRVFLMYLLLIFGGTAIMGLSIALTEYPSESNYQYCLEHGFTYSDRSVYSEIATWAFTFVIAATVYASMAFNRAKTKQGRISMMMVPALESEKYWAAWLLYVPVFFIVAVVAALWGDLVRYVALSCYFGFGTGMIQTVFNVIGADWEGFSIFTSVIVGLQSFYFLGAIVWPSNSFIKTFAALSIIGTVYLIAGVTMYYFLLADVAVTEPFVPQQVKNATEPWMVCWGVNILISIINYTLAYMRLRETQVIQR